MIPLLLAAALSQAAETRVDRFERCGRLWRTDPAAAVAYAKTWQATDPDRLARACEGQAQAAGRNWREAADAFQRAATSPDPKGDADAAAFWSQAGNAWLAAGEPTRAVTAFDAALAAGALSSFERGELLLDRARARVAGDDPAAARADLDLALIAVPNDPLAWLLSATLARRVKDGARAAKDIREALRRSPDDASVQLESGNIAAQAGDEAGARAAWAQAARLAPTASAGQQALAALRQFDAPPTQPSTPATR